MKIGMIGLGDIAQKAYLPVLTTYEDIEIHLCTRDKAVLEKLRKKYRIEKAFSKLDDLLSEALDGVFIHAATEAHEALAEKCLLKGLHVFVDKPISYDYATAKRLVNLAKEKKLIFMVGFNRRFAKPYTSIQKEKAPNMILVEKHRANHPDLARRFIFDDFIHVIDTMLNFLQDDINHIDVSGRIENDQLYHVMLTLHSDSTTAIGIMNRDAGMNHELAKIFYDDETITVENINHRKHYQNRTVILDPTDDWQATLEKRGFYQMTRAFLNFIKDKDVDHFDYTIDLKRHELAEKILEKLS